MTDEELNEIFRAIRHRRTLSWATIEKLANEVREGRKAKEVTLKRADLAAFYGYQTVPTTMFPPKPDDLPPKAKEALDNISASIQRKYEDKVCDLWNSNKMTFTSVDPKTMKVGLATRDLNDLYKECLLVPSVRHQSVSHNAAIDSLADSPKKE